MVKHKERAPAEGVIYSYITEEARSRKAKELESAGFAINTYDKPETPFPYRVKIGG